MRIRWNDESLDTFSKLNFMTGFATERKTGHRTMTVWLYIDDEQVGIVNTERFCEDPGAIEDWIKGVVDEVMDRGYLDMRNYADMISIY